MEFLDPVHFSSRRCAPRCAAAPRAERIQRRIIRGRSTRPAYPPLKLPNHPSVCDPLLHSRPVPRLHLIRHHPVLARSNRHLARGPTPPENRWKTGGGRGLLPAHSCPNSHYMQEYSEFREFRWQNLTVIDRKRFIVEELLPQMATSALDRTRNYRGAYPQALSVRMF
jgi:hypothetical protein